MGLIPMKVCNKDAVAEACENQKTKAKTSHWANSSPFTKWQTLCLFVTDHRNERQFNRQPVAQHRQVVKKNKTMVFLSPQPVNKKNDKRGRKCSEPPARGAPQAVYTPNTLMQNSEANSGYLINGPIQPSILNTAKNIDCLNLLNHRTSASRARLDQYQIQLSLAQSLKSLKA